MFSRLSKIKKDSSNDSPRKAIVTADDLNFSDSATLDYFTELMGGFIHKHNNYLTVTQGYSQLLMVDEHQESVAQSAKTIQKSAQKAIDLNSRIIACTKTDAPKLETFDLTGYFERRCEKTRSAALTQGFDFEDEFSGSGGAIKADLSWLNIILDEIFQNAYDAVEEISSARIRLLSHSSSPLESDTKQFRFLEIRDNGAEVSSEKLDKVFKPFFTTKGRDHLGIGLTRAGVLAGIMGMRIGIVSSREGTAVHLAIPSG